MGMMYVGEGDGGGKVDGLECDEDGMARDKECEKGE